ncbi:Hsp20 family protein [Swingsia samuiensis]|uniref:Hsp20 family protein n=1 Tax=Swingsia samuiensis TaxID=1293412 RepID=A0A4Y6UMI1_9PROT|nr:Hsp20 family protein [Swingsia samuiensis]QDH17888.1 Hsp20 family protein [Swingsia samuiensis]
MGYDFTPLFRSAIGFDRLAHVAGKAANAQAIPSYPPYNIEKTAETEYALTMALAGFSPDEVEVLQENNTLVIRGNITEAARAREWLYRGIATRAFERRFVLADHIEIEKAELLNGLLTIIVKQVLPEAIKPRRIPIITDASHRQRQASNEQAA